MTFHAVLTGHEVEIEIVLFRLLRQRRRCSGHVVRARARLALHLYEVLSNGLVVPGRRAEFPVSGRHVHGDLVVALRQVLGVPGTVVVGRDRHPGAPSAGLAVVRIGGGLAVVHVDREPREGIGVVVGVRGAAVVVARDLPRHRPGSHNIFQGHQVKVEAVLGCSRPVQLFEVAAHRLGAAGWRTVFPVPWYVHGDQIVALSQAAGFPGTVVPGLDRHPFAESARLAAVRVGGDLAVVHANGEPREWIGVAVRVGGAAVVGPRDPPGHRPNALGDIGHQVEVQAVLGRFRASQLFEVASPGFMASGRGAVVPVLGQVHGDQVMAFSQAMGLPCAVVLGQDRHPRAESALLAAGPVCRCLAVVHANRQSPEGVGVGIGVGGVAVIGARHSSRHRSRAEEDDEVRVGEVRRIRLAAACRGVGVDQAGGMDPDGKRVTAGDRPVVGPRVGRQHR